MENKKGRDGPCLSVIEAGYFLSILSVFLSCATALDAAKAEAVTAVNIAATIRDSSLLISFSWLVFENGWTRRVERYPEPVTHHRKRALTAAAHSFAGVS